jgi:Domain of unknown function (DUF4159)
MRIAKIWWLAAGIAAAVGSSYAFQREFREYPGMEYNDFPVPADGRVPADFVFARLMYPEANVSYGGFGRRARGDWREGYTYWTQDYPRADRHFLLALRRLTLIDARSAEQPVNLDDDTDVYNWPWLYAVQPGHWDLTDSQAAKLRDYLNRGGFFMCDDFWGEDQWEVFEDSMKRVFPDREPMDLDNSEQIFHTVYNLDDRYQVPGARYLSTGVSYKCEGCPAKWRGITDQTGRVVAAMTYNSDLGDSWEFADDPRYDEKYSALGIRIAVNYIVYAMTH